MADLGYNALDPQYKSEIKNRRRMAEMLAKTSEFNPNQMAGGLVVPISPLEGLVKGLSKGVETYQSNKADTMEQDAENKKAKVYADVLGQYQADPQSAIEALGQVDPKMAFELQKEMLDRQNKIDVQKLKGQSAGGGFTVNADGTIEFTGAPRKLEANERKQVMEDALAEKRSAGTMTSLNEAVGKSQKGDSGFGAPLLATIGNNLNTFIGRPESQASLDTVEYDNFVKTIALPQLKDLFGGNPTEGERKVLLELQASGGKTKGERKVILENAMYLANQRAKIANEMRQGVISGDIYNPAPMQGMEQPQIPQQPQTPQVPLTKRDKLKAKGVPDAIIEQMLSGQGVK
jgi:hypothetical protein